MQDVNSLSKGVHKTDRLCDIYTFAKVPNAHLKAIS